VAGVASEKSLGGGSRCLFIEGGAIWVCVENVGYVEETGAVVAGELVRNAKTPSDRIAVYLTLRTSRQPRDISGGEFLRHGAIMRQ